MNEMKNLMHEITCANYLLGVDGTLLTVCQWKFFWTWTFYPLLSVSTINPGVVHAFPAGVGDNYHQFLSISKLICIKFKSSS